ncbi:uncharacterized protein KY384_001599 [Bacidia gigantensis]|uniref:uncharacterized protein n=1 Tax=Bacidia gigantensis TaxID=2732470 RepID=UPI001D039C32|nr:uncharacterized protein KY384_001599 [Bacidia gigantensis]KAG8533858.1 hypothetical protein KY384_001599 [Bacidia gigantensis]
MDHILRIVGAMLRDDPKERLLSWEVQLDLFDMLYPDMPNQDREEQGLSIIQSPPLNEPLRSSPLHRAASRGDSIRIRLLFGAGWLSSVRDNRDLHPEQIVPLTPYENLKRDLSRRRILETEVDIFQDSSVSNLSTPALMLGPFISNRRRTDDATALPQAINTYRAWYQKMHPEGMNAPLIISSATRTRLHMAAIQADDRAMKSHPEIFEDLYTADEYGKTPLHYAARSATGDIVDMMLLQVRLPVDLLEAKDLNGDTPLHCAASRGNEQTVRSLLQFRLGDGALRMENDAAMTPFQVADHGGRETVAKLLRTADDGPL